MADQNNNDHIYQRAHELAVLGRCPSEIIATLVEEGYPEAKSMLNSELIRADLRHLAMVSTSSDILALMWRLEQPRKDERVAGHQARDRAFPGRKSALNLGDARIPASGSGSGVAAH